MADDFVGEERAPVQGTRVGAQAVVLFVIAGVFAWFVNVLANHPDAGTGGLARNTWIVFLLVVMVILFVIMLLLRDPLFAPREQIPESWDDEWQEIPDDQPRSAIGCPACGTVFYATDEERDQGTFHCSNCGRAGRVQNHYLQRQQIRVADCAHCGHTYEQFRSESECPACHQHNVA